MFDREVLLVIRVRNLKKDFGSFTAVNDVSFDVEAGEIFAFLGPNGAGKTTTIKMLTTLLKPTAGSIELDGLDPLTHQNEARKRFGIVFQDPSLDGDLTAWENLEVHGVLYHVPHKVRRQRMEELLKLFELWERRNDQVKKFSGGMKRRLEIARGFLHTPRILFLDEPTLGLDPTQRRRIWGFLRRLCSENGTTLFLTTHYLEEAEAVSDRIGVLNDGRLLAIGTMQELRNQLRYRYTLRIPSGGETIGPFEGQKIVRKDGELQVMTTEDEALRISRDLVEHKTRFSMNPVDLDDVFYYIVSEDESRRGGAKR